MPTRLENLFANRFVQRVLHKTAFATGLALCTLWGVAQAIWPDAAAPAEATAWEWPSQWEGAALRPLALGPVEQRFARQFPGAIARMTDGQRVLVLRHVTAPTRMLHPAEDCYRALGYGIASARLEHDAHAQLWRCFTATRAGRAGGQPLRVCERTTDAQGQAFTDTSAWYWSALRGHSRGPWLAVTTATPLASVVATGLL
ncbi:hypothetical protein [Pseudorhodoferax soli]|uniref:Methanolan biosynthesis EpsI domain-containing protein n=1 Tax=Pseudorhodoferax soli TaxID=545864 RepID=A0A368XU81_9BURK|nr:hypothetical protein [Pseudorhodoferax soli]RCW71610.1 hypothetical protein DES41_104430 [Pseudorhodoferax soli]